MVLLIIMIVRFVFLSFLLNIIINVVRLNGTQRFACGHRAFRSNVVKYPLMFLCAKIINETFSDFRFSFIYFFRIEYAILLFRIGCSYIDKTVTVCV